MARTLIGQLILRLKAEGMGEADKVQQTLRDVEDAARTLGKIKAGDWGAGFVKQLSQLKATPEEIEAIRRSWDNLHNNFSSKNIAAAMRKQSISTWKTATIGHLAAVRAQADETEKRILAMNRSIGMGLKPFMVMGGGYTAAYMGGIMGREALTAASNERRVQAEAKYAGLDSGERGKIDSRADELAERYRLNKAQIFEVMKEASLSMPSTDAALAVSDEMARAYLVLSNLIGPEGAIGGLRQFNKAMDNIEKVTPEEYRYGIENFMKAQQVVGLDMDPTAFAEAIKYARAGGKVFGEEFLFQWLPMLIAESGGSDSGTQLRAAFDQFIVGRASKKALAEQRALGLRDDADRLLNQEKFTKNPLTWIWDTLLPKLREKGVDTENETELARVVGELTNNRLSSDLILRAILSMQQYRNLVEKRLPNAVGLDAADMIQTDNPFAAWEGFKSSLENLSAAVLPMDHVAGGLNTLADAINTLAASARDNPALTALGIGVAGAGAYGGGKYAIGKMGDLFGLRGSALALDGSAAALTRAAIALGGAGVADGVIPDGLGNGKDKGRGGGFGSLMSISALIATAAAFAASMNLGQSELLQTDAEIAHNRDMNRRIKEHFEKTKGDGNAWWRFLLGAAAEPNFDLGEHFKIKTALNDAPDIQNGDRSAAKSVSSEGTPAKAPSPSAPSNSNVSPSIQFGDTISEAQRTGAEILAALSVSAKPNIDLASLLAARDLAQQTLSLIRQIGTAAQSSSSSADRQMRRNMSDFGVSP